MVEVEQNQQGCWRPCRNLRHWELCATNRTVMNLGPLLTALINGSSPQLRRLSTPYCFVSDMQNVPVHWVSQHELDYTSNLFRLQSLMAQSIQTKGHDQLIPEFALITVTTSLPQSPHKLLARLGRGGNDGEKGSEERYKVGIYFNHREHLQKALCLHHPAFTHKGVPDDLKKAVFFVATHSLAEVAGPTV